MLTRTPPPELLGDHPGRPPWSAPGGRDLLAGVAVLFVLVAVLVVVTREGAPPPSSGAAQPFPRASGADVATAAAADWQDVPIATSVVELGPALSQPVGEGIAAARARIDRCVAVERRRSPGAGEASGHGADPAELVLRLAARAGAVHVVSVEQRARGASPMLADCARRHLDGDAFPALGGVTGRRYRLRLSLR